MDGVTLNSGDFEDAVHDFTICVNRLEEIQRQYRLAVDKMVTAIGMEAENLKRYSEGKAIAYDEAAFQNI